MNSGKIFGMSTITLGKSRLGGRGYAGQTVQIFNLDTWYKPKALPVLKAHVCCMYGAKAWAWHLLAKVSRVQSYKLMGMHTYSLFDRSRIV